MSNIIHQLSNVFIFWTDLSQWQSMPRLWIVPMKLASRTPTCRYRAASSWTPAASLQMFSPPPSCGSPPSEVDLTGSTHTGYSLTFWPSNIVVLSYERCNFIFRMRITKFSLVQPDLYRVITKARQIYCESFRRMTLKGFVPDLITATQAPVGRGDLKNPWHLDFRLN